MPVDEPAASRPAVAPDARFLMRAALTGSLATLERDSGHPYASLILLATEPDATPIFLISRLALHTRNLEKDPRASVLLDGSAGLADPMRASRLTLSGEAHPTHSDTARRRFLARHPAAAPYADFADFAFYALSVQLGHYIGGFGRIVDLGRDALIAPAGDAEALVAAEADILAHMNADHTEAIGLLATVCGRPPGPWRMAGIDPDGIDLLHCTNAARIAFPHRIRTPAEARTMLATLTRQARAERNANGAT